MSISEKKYNYLEPYVKDRFAEERFWEPIVIDWDKVYEVTQEEEFKNWPDSPAGQQAKKLGLNVRKWRVSCPDPEHGTFNQLIPVEKNHWSHLCQHCISREMNRVLQLRTQRYEDWIKKQKEDRRK